MSDLDIDPVSDAENLNKEIDQLNNQLQTLSTDYDSEAGLYAAESELESAKATALSNAKDSLTSIKEKAKTLRDNLKAAENDVASKISAAKDAAEKEFEKTILAPVLSIKSDLDSFKSDISNAAAALQSDAEQTKQVLTTLIGYSETVLGAINNIVVELDNDVSKLVNIDRLNGLWSFVSNVIDHMKVLCDMAIHLIEMVPGLAKAAYAEIESKVAELAKSAAKDVTKVAKITHTTMVSSLTTINNQLHTVNSTYNDSTNNRTFKESTVLNGMLIWMGVIPDSVWQTATKILDLNPLNVLESLVDTWANDMGNLHAKELLIANAEGI